MTEYTYVSCSRGSGALLQVPKATKSEYEDWVNPELERDLGSKIADALY